MQGEQTVTLELFQEPFFPWYTRLFVLYLLIVLLMVVVRTVRVTWFLWKRRKASKEYSDPNSQTLWKLNRTRAASFRNLAHLSVLLNTAVLTMSASELMRNLATAKRNSWVAVAVNMADPLKTFTVGLLFCAGLYLCAMILEAAILRQHLRIDRDVATRQASQGS